MKTELVTNVSHDLRTPLTAIITYTDLLKNEKDEEKRKEYIEVLEKKNLRLKVLIEDLFEISKAASRSVAMHFMKVDIVDLIKQAGLENDSKIKDADLDFRWKLPDHKLIMWLDSQKTYRIFENLIVNITKYAMPHTRVYIVMEELENEVHISMKNISAFCARRCIPEYGRLRPGACHRKEFCRTAARLAENINRSGSLPGGYRPAEASGPAGRRTEAAGGAGNTKWNRKLKGS